MKKNNNNASDKSAIKSSLRTEINKITESEGNLDKLTCFKFSPTDWIMGKYNVVQTKHI
jgi:hypothetical protein